MALIRFPSEAPVRSALVDRAMMVSLRWLQWFQLVGQRIGNVSRLDAAYDPPNLGPGAAITIDVTFDGVSLGDYVTGVSFAPMTVATVPTSAVRVFANVSAADTVSVTFFNVSGGAVDLDAGTLRLQVEQAA